MAEAEGTVIEARAPIFDSPLSLRPVTHGAVLREDLTTQGLLLIRVPSRHY